MVIGVRRATEDDLDRVLFVCQEALEWSPGDCNEGFFRWKHLANPFGPSDMWVAEDVTDAKAELVGVRAMMRWRLERPGSAPMTVARAVDTSTLSSHQGQGIFTRLTMAAVDEFSSDRSVHGIFNTPNEKSRPGYLKMGWWSLGRTSLRVRPRSPSVLPRIAGNRTAGDKWGRTLQVGLAPEEALADDEAVEAAIAASAPSHHWHTPLSAAYVQWRSSFEPLGCRVSLLGAHPAEGFIIFRVRERGDVLQLSLLHVVDGGASPSRTRRAIKQLLDETGADVAVGSGHSLPIATGAALIPRSGPVLTWRPLEPNGKPPGKLDLDLGTLESF